MSRRYGRNQKRRARAEIQRQQEAMTAAAAALKGQAADLAQALYDRDHFRSQLIEWAARVSRLLGEKSALAHSIASQDVTAGMFMSAARSGFLRDYPKTGLQYLTLSPSEVTTGAVRVLELLCLQAGSHMDEASGRMTYSIRSPSGERALAIDRMTLLDLQRSEDMRLAYHLYRMLIQPWMDIEGGRK